MLKFRPGQEERAVALAPAERSARETAGWRLPAGWALEGEPEREFERAEFALPAAQGPDLRLEVQAAWWVAE